jgi:hypothetical protein
VNRAQGSRSAAVKSTLEAISLHIDTPGGSFHQVIASLRMPSKFVISIYIVFSPCPDVILDIGQLNTDDYPINLIKVMFALAIHPFFWNFENLNLLNFWSLSDSSVFQRTGTA